MSAPISISLEFTPNPSTLKYVVDRELLSRGAANFTSKESTAKSPLAQKLFEVPGVAAVMIGKNFVTVTKGEDGDWETLNNGINKTLQDHLSENLPIMDPSYIAPESATSNEVEAKIKQILDAEIRPAVAMDGGDIDLDRYEDGVVYLFMQGSCAGCPSSTATLKMGIERKLKEAIPEIKEVVSV
ncbi:MAG: NifU family protein [Bacteriovoracia bacterium]